MIGKKILTIVLVATIGLSLFVGLAFAVGPGMDPITQILQLLTGMQNTTRVLAVIHNYTILNSAGSAKLAIETDKPVLFTATVEGDVSPATRIVQIWRGFDGTYTVVTKFDDTIKTVSFVSQQMWLTGDTSDFIGYDFDIMVQGAQGTKMNVTYSP